MVNYGYAKHVVHLVEVTAPADLKAGASVALSAKASYLVCADVCIPEDANLQLTLPTAAAAGPVDPSDAALFGAAPQRTAERGARATSARIQNGQLLITLGKEWGATLPQIKSLAFFPYDDGSIEYAAPQTLTRSKDAVELALKVGYQPPKGGSVRGVLLATEQSGHDVITVPMEIESAISGCGRRG